MKQVSVNRYVKCYQKGKLLTYHVNDLKDARKALTRLKVPAGWYIERSKASGGVLVHEKIYPL